jgi:hypothetical protein
VTFGYAFHASNAVFLPLPLKDEVVSHPVKEWNKGKTLDLSGPETRKKTLSLV